MCVLGKGKKQNRVLVNLVLGFGIDLCLRKGGFLLTATHFVMARMSGFGPSIGTRFGILILYQPERAKTYNESVSVDSEGNDKIAF